MGELKMTFLWSTFHSSPLNFFEKLSGHMRKEESSPEHSLSYIILPHPVPAICFLKYKIAAFQGLEFRVVCNVLWKKKTFFLMNSNCCYIQTGATGHICMLLHFNLHDSLWCGSFGWKGWRCWLTAAGAELVSGLGVGSHCLICSLQIAVPQASPGAQIRVSWLFL